MHTLWVFLGLVTSVASIDCPVACQIDVKSTHLQYPANVVVKTVHVPLTTVEVYLDGAGHTTRIERKTRSLPPQRQTLTWVHDGITLTFPTTYAQYTGFSRIEVEPSGEICSTKTVSLALPAPTNWAPLILPASAVPNPASVAPTVVQYLNSLPTVVEQLGRAIGPGACNPIIGGKMRRQDPVSSTLTTATGTATSVTSVPEVDPTTITNPANSTTVDRQTQFTTSTLPSSTSATPTSTPPETSTPSSTPSPPSTEPTPPPPPPPSTSTPIPSSTVISSSSVTTDGGVTTSAGDGPAPPPSSTLDSSSSSLSSTPSGTQPPSSTATDSPPGSTASSSSEPSPSGSAPPEPSSSESSPSASRPPPPVSNSDIPPEATLATSIPPGNTNLPPAATRRPTTGTTTGTPRTSTTGGPLEWTGAATPAHGARVLSKMEVILIAIAGLGLGWV